jgi:iron complex outermembrane receptor protein
MAVEVRMSERALVARAIKAALAAGTGVTLGVSGTVVAQDDIAVQQKITVTGSRIKRVDFEGPQPLTVIDREAIDRSGNLTVSDVVRQTTYNSFGSFQQRSGNSSQSLNAVNLRGLGADKTLVLINGRRMPGSGTEAGEIQNLTMIPLAAVERIEILRDGASAIYGTDALAGVINVILRKDYEGMHLSADWGRPTQTGGDEDAYSITGGIGGARGNVTFSFNAEQREIVFNADRSFTAEATSGAGFPGSYFAYLATDDPRNPTGGFVPLGLFPDPRCPEELNSDPRYPNSELRLFGTPDGQGQCRYNYASVSATEAENDTKSFFVTANYDITPDTSFFAQGLFSYNESFGRYAPSPVFGLPWSQDYDNNPTNPANPTNAIGDPFAGQSFAFDFDDDGVDDFEVDGPFDLSVFYRNVPTGPRDGNFEDELLDYLAGLQGSWDWLGGMDWQIGAQWSQTTTNAEGTGIILEPAINSAVEGGELDIFGVQDASNANIAAQASQISFTDVRNSRFRIASGDGQIGFDAFQLGNGPVPVVLGFEYRDEEFDEFIDEQSQAGNNLGAAGQVVPVSAGRVVKSLFAETAIPVLASLEANFAVRYDDYNDFGTTLNPKASLAFRPLDVLMMRATYGRGFQAPDMFSLYSAPTTRGAGGVVDTYQCSMTPEDTTGDGRADTVDDAEDLPFGHPCNDASFNNPFFGIRGGNRDLNPTESEQWNVGFVWNALEDLSLTVDYFNIDIDDEIGQIDFQRKLDQEFLLRQAGATGTRVGDVTRSAGGRLDTIESLATNIATKKTQGLDAEVSYGLSMGRFGDLDTTLYWTHVLEFEESDSSDPTQTVHTDGDLFAPKDRGQLNLAWSMGDYTATIISNYIARQSGADFCADDDDTCYLASSVVWDVQVSYATPWNGQITVGARNVLDKDPVRQEDFYDNYQHDVFGRVPYVRWEQDL